MTKACSLIGKDSYHIDHIGPLASLLEIPLLTQDPLLVLKYSSLYPNLNLSVNNWNYSYLHENYDIIIYPFKPSPLFEEAKNSYLKTHPHAKPTAPKRIFCPHGNTDKGYSSDIPWNSAHFIDADQVLFYGKRMKICFEKQGILNQLKSYAFIGNYRKIYYEKHRHFYNKLVQEKILDQFENKAPLIFYAPSWNDLASSSSFNDFFPYLSKLPSNCNLILKPHPYLLKEADICNKLNELKRLPNLIVLEDFPPIYPLLDACDIYLGDLSNVNYDALSCYKPMFFLNHLNKNPQTDPEAYSFQAGFAIEKDLFHQAFDLILEKYRELSKQYLPIQKRIYQEAFTDTFDLKSLLQK